MIEEKVVEAELDVIHYWVECPLCNNDQTFWRCDFNENEKHICVHCDYEFTVKLPINKYREALQDIVGIVNQLNDQGLRVITPDLQNAIERARTVMENA